MQVLIVGVSTRAAAESAARAGLDVIALDAYADLDQHAFVRALSLPRDFGKPFITPEAIAAVVPELSSDAVAYLSNLENLPKVVDVLATRRALWGNGSDVLRRVRDPKLLAHAFVARGIRAPRVITAGESTEQHRDVARWLIKPRMSGGGHGVRAWANESVTRGHYLQEFIDGVPGSVIFVAAGGRGVALGSSRQLVGESVFGSSGFRYCGNILIPHIDERTADDLSALVDTVAAAFHLVGVGSIDFVSTDSERHPVEVNPRWSASMELVERARGISLFGLHADACERGMLPTFTLAQLPIASGAHGKAIVFARKDIVMPDTSPWLDDPSVRDVPRPGEHIAAGQPICTVFAVGSDDATCYAALVERAERIYAAIT